MTITNGLGQFQAVGATFAGYVTPQGNLKLDSGSGATVIVNFDPQTGIFRGQADSINCRYDVAWQKAEIWVPHDHFSRMMLSAR